MSGPAPLEPASIRAVRVRIRGIVQGVGFRPFVYREAVQHGVRGWVLNGEDGVEVHAEGSFEAVEGFLSALRTRTPPAVRIASFEVASVPPQAFGAFEIRASRKQDRPTVRISPDLPICAACLEELFDPADRRYLYPYINCTDCGPRYSIVLGLPYDRPQTTMKDWLLCPDCDREYHDPLDRRFHAQPVACPACGPHYRLRIADQVEGADAEAIARAAALLQQGWILAVKGIGGYHLACDARNSKAVWALRERKFRKEKPFALMVRNLEVARRIAQVSEASAALLLDPARPIVLCPARVELPGVAPENDDLGIMLPYAPLHHLLFARGAPDVLVMTSANRSSEPIAYRDDDAFARLGGIADGFLVGERPIARRVDDSVARVGPFGPVILRRSRGYAPAVVATLPTRTPILAVGADLKNAITLVVEGQAFCSQHIGDLDHLDAYRAFQETIRDLCALYEVDVQEAVVAYDAHPEYRSTLYAQQLGRVRVPVQHHRAHIASVLAEHAAWDVPVVGFAFDGTGYGDDGAIWGGEVFVGSLREGLRRAAHLRYAALPGGDATARFPVQAAAGFLAQLTDLPDLSAPPFALGDRFRLALELVRKGVRTFPTTSVGRLFDTVAALCGFVREITFEGQAAMWLEHQARHSPPVPAYPLPLAGEELDWRPLLASVLRDRVVGHPVGKIARAFHAGLAEAILQAGRTLARSSGARVVVLSGGVFQNALLLEEIALRTEGAGFEIWTNQTVPPNDGGISLGQAALVCASE